MVRSTSFVAANCDSSTFFGIRQSVQERPDVAYLTWKDRAPAGGHPPPPFDARPSST